MNKIRKYKTLKIEFETPEELEAFDNLLYAVRIDVYNQSYMSDEESEMLLALKQAVIDTVEINK